MFSQKCGLLRTKCLHVEENIVIFSEFSPRKTGKNVGFSRKNAGKRQNAWSLILTLHFNVERASYGARCLRVDAAALVRSCVLELYVVYHEFLAVTLGASTGRHRTRRLLPVDPRCRAKTRRTRHFNVTCKQ